MRKKIVLGAAIVGTAQIFSRLFDVISISVIARFLTPADFGLVSIATSILFVVTAVTQLPISDVLVQKKNLERADLDTAFTLNVVRCTLIFIVLTAAAKPIAAFFSDMRIENIIYVISFTTLFQGFTSPSMVYFARNLNYRPSAISQIAGKTVGITASISIAVISKSYWALIIGMVASPLVTAVLTFIMAPYRPKIDFSRWRGIMGFAGWVSVSRTISALNQQADRIFIGKILGKTQLGYYTTGSDFASLATYAVAEPILQPIFSGFSRISGDLAHMRRAYLNAQQSVTMVVLPFGVGTAAVAKSLIPIMLGPGWDAVIPVVMWLAPFIALQAITVPVQAVVMALARPRVFAMREALYLCFRLPLTIFAAWQYGLIAAVIARSISSIFYIYMNSSIIKAVIGIGNLYQIFNVWRSVISSILMGVCVFYIQREFSGGILVLIASVIVGIVVYFSCHFGLWFLSGRREGAETFLLETVDGVVGRLSRLRPR